MRAHGSYVRKLRQEAVGGKQQIELMLSPSADISANTYLLRVHSSGHRPKCWGHSMELSRKQGGLTNDRQTNM